jgi:hypothetical protein
MDFCEDVEHYHCGDCEFFHSCKRIDHANVKFAVPWFKSYDKNQFSGIICSDFCPAQWNVYAHKNWNGFEYYWPRYVEQWLPYSNTNSLVFFTLHDDTSVRYGVPLMNFVYGDMFDGDLLKAVEKVYYKRSNSSPIGYKLVHEKINGININNKENYDG